MYIHTDESEPGMSLSWGPITLWADSRDPGENLNLRDISCEVIVLRTDGTPLEVPAVRQELISGVTQVGYRLIDCFETYYTRLGIMRGPEDIGTFQVFGSEGDAMPSLSPDETALVDKAINALSNRIYPHTDQFVFTYNALARHMKVAIDAGGEEDDSEYEHAPVGETVH